MGSTVMCGGAQAEVGHYKVSAPTRERNVPQAHEAVASRGASPAEGGGGERVMRGHWAGGEGVGSRKPPCAC